MNKIGCQWLFLETFQNHVHVFGVYYANNPWKSSHILLNQMKLKPFNPYWEIICNSIYDDFTTSTKKLLTLSNRGIYHIYICISDLGHPYLSPKYANQIQIQIQIFCLGGFQIQIRIQIFAYLNTNTNTYLTPALMARWLNLCWPVISDIHPETFILTHWPLGNWNEILATVKYLI